MINEYDIDNFIYNINNFAYENYVKDYVTDKINLSNLNINNIVINLTTEDKNTNDKVINNVMTNVNFLKINNDDNNIFYVRKNKLNTYVKLQPLSDINNIYINNKYFINDVICYILGDLITNNILHNILINIYNFIVKSTYIDDLNLENINKLKK